MHSSPSFGSRRRCSHSNLSPADHGRPVVRLIKQRVPPVTFIAHQGLTPKYSHIRQTPWSVFQDGIMNAIFSASRPHCKGFWGKLASRTKHVQLPFNQQTPLAHHTAIQASTKSVVTKFPTDRAHAELPNAHSELQREQDEALAPLAHIASLQTISGTFNSLFKVLFTFPSQYLFAIGQPPIFSVRWSLPPA